MRFMDRILKYYVRRCPIEKGKTRIIESVAKIAAGHTEVEVETLFGARMILDLSQYVQRQIYFRGVYEPHVLTLMERLHNKLHFRYMLDVGANVGQHSLYMSMLDNPPKVIAFEPEQNTFARLQKNIELNGKGEFIQAFNVAVSDQPGNAFLVRPADGNDGMNYIVETRRESTESKVQVIALDQFFDGYVSLEAEGPILMKIDVEGAEAKVIRGARGLLEKGVVKVIFVEICQGHLARFGDSVSCLVDMIESTGLVGFSVKRGGLEPLRACDISAFCEGVFVSKDIEMVL